jgi:carbamoyltransferase
MNILGISAFYHDAAATIISDGLIVAAAQEERFTRIKHDQAFPVNAINFCLYKSGIRPSQIDYVAFYDKPFLKFDRLLETYLAYAPRGFSSFSTSLPIWLKDKLFQRSIILDSLKELWGKEFEEDRLLFSEHHLSHAASAYYPSPFNKAAVLTLDGVGEWATTTVGLGDGSRLELIKEINFPHSIGLLYSAFTYYTGFKVNSGEYKVMGLAPYGTPKYVDIIKNHLIDIKSDGSFALDMSYFNYCTGHTMTNHKFDDLFGGPRRKEESNLTQKEMDLAASIQSITEEVMLKLSKNIRSETGLTNLCLAGGVALNCVANGKLLKQKEGFNSIWIQPAAGDAGGSIGAALAIYYQMLKMPRLIDQNSDGMKGSYLGPEFDQVEIEERLKNIGAIFYTLSDVEIIKFTAQEIASGKAVGWFQGRMEFGPRSLGNRSILADPRSPDTQKQLNLKIKYRESFRPFAPSILKEYADEWFELNTDSPYMLFVSNVSKSKLVNTSNNSKQLFGIDLLNEVRSSVPAITHVDNSARIQTVDKSVNPKFHALLTSFYELTGCPILVNTSFNVRGEPVVCTPEDAFKCFMGTGLDLLVIGNAVVVKEKQNQDLILDYKHTYELD